MNSGQINSGTNRLLKKLERPRAIAMWDFSWLERRWPGAGYEDWAVALDELAGRGYDAVRIDAYPHLLARGSTREWVLTPAWAVHDWGAPDVLHTTLQPQLNTFLTLCRERGILVGLSTWFRTDEQDVRRHLVSPEQHAEIWLSALETVRSAGLMDAVMYVDFCNEWTLPEYSTFFVNPPRQTEWASEASMRWMRKAVEIVRAEHPGLPLTFSFNHFLPGCYEADVGFLDLFETHLWMVSKGDYYERMGYKWEAWRHDAYRPVVLHGEALYRSDEAYWRKCLTDLIDEQAVWSTRRRRPLATTECWGPVVWKDWPGLDWGWVKDVCAFGTLHAVETGRWAAVGTSNFCGPQFRGMWRDVEWHRRLTDRIKAGKLPEACG